MSLAVLLLLLLSPGAGPFDIALFPTSVAPAAEGSARLVYAASPFGIAMTADGRSRYDVVITAAHLPPAGSLGRYTSYVAWEVTTELGSWHRLGAVRNGKSIVGSAELNKFLLVITAEADSLAPEHKGPVVLHGNSPSGWLQSFITHPLFRGMN
jgi:hypothetical protein